MAEPVYIARTSAPENVATSDAILSWFTGKAGYARKELGCRFQRMSVSEDGTALLYEAWKRTPRDQGPLRWQPQPGEDPDGNEETDR